MSNTLALRIDDFDLYTEHKSVNPTVLSVYSESDKRIIPIPPEEDLEEEEDEYEEDGPTHLVEYTIAAHAALDRLELMGFTLSEVSKLFVKGLAEEVAGLDELRKRPTTSWGEFAQMVEAKEKVFESLTLEQWFDGFRQLLSMEFEGVQRFDWWNPTEDEIPLHVRYMLGQGSWGMYGFPGQDSGSPHYEVSILKGVVSRTF
jgi:hypothetical protein